MLLHIQSILQWVSIVDHACGPRWILLVSKQRSSGGALIFCLRCKCRVSNFERRCVFTVHHGFKSVIWIRQECYIYIFIYSMIQVPQFPNCSTARPTTCTWPSSLTSVCPPLASTWSTQVWGEMACLPACHFICCHFISASICHWLPATAQRCKK